MAVVLDGGKGAAGGAVVRAALAMSALTQQEVTIENVRGGTSHPGVDTEDILLARAFAKMCDARHSPLVKGTPHLTFSPSRRPKGLRVPVENDDALRKPSASVLAAAILPVAARADSYTETFIDGETYGRASLSFDAFQNVVLPTLAATGIYASTDLDAAAFGRDADGRIGLYAEPSGLNALDWSSRGSLRETRAIVATGHLHRGLAERAIDHLVKVGRSQGVEIAAEHVEVGARGPGIHVTVWSRWERGFASGSAMGARGIRAETLAQQAYEELFWTSRTSATVDPFLADHLVIPMAMSGKGGVFTVPQITPRLLAIVWTVKQFTPSRLLVRGHEGGPGTVELPPS